MQRITHCMNKANGWPGRIKGDQPLVFARCQGLLIETLFFDCGDYDGGKSMGHFLGWFCALILQWSMPAHHLHQNHFFMHRCLMRFLYAY